MDEFQGKVALVTGAASGIGRASALAFARRGAKVVLADIDVELGRQTERLVAEAGGEALFLKADVSKSEDVRSLIDRTVEVFGRLDCAHNNAGINIERGIGVPTADYREEDWDLVIDVNLKGVFLCMKYEIQVMLREGRGAIVNTSSISGLSGRPADPAYVSSKFGVVGLTKTAALEYAKTGIRINCICPGPVRDTRLTERVERRIPGSLEMAAAMVPMGRVGRPEEIAEAVVWLCSDAASFITGAALSIDGGLAAI